MQVEHRHYLCVERSTGIVFRLVYQPVAPINTNSTLFFEADWVAQHRYCKLAEHPKAIHINQIIENAL